MTTVVVPFAGSEGKTRLELAQHLRNRLSLAMLADVLAAASAVGPIVLVTSDENGAAVSQAWQAEVVEDPGEGQGAAVAAALTSVSGRVLVVNGDLPCVVPDDLRALEAAIPDRGLALVEALDGTTNALGLSSPDIFQPLYGRDSARRFRALDVETVSVTVSNLAEDVDLMADLERLELRCGRRTQSVLAGILSGVLQ